MGLLWLDDDDSPTTHAHMNSDIQSLPSSLKILLVLLTDANCSQSAHQGSCQCTVKPDHTSNCLLISLQARVTPSLRQLHMCLHADVRWTDILSIIEFNAPTI